MFHSSLNIQIRFLNLSDIDVIKNLCEKWFPIKYPDTWYEEIASNHSHFYSLVATLDNHVVGLLVTELKSYLYLNYEDFGFLSKTFERKNIYVAYILTLGVVKHLRRNGIASMLVKILMENLQNNPLQKDCKAIYLHVLTTNTYAICFYEKLKFQRYKLLPLYYSINDTACDGYSYIYYLNGGQPPLWQLPLLNPKSYLIIIQNALKFFYQTTVTLFKCDHFRSFTLTGNYNLNFRPYKLKRMLNDIVFLICPKCFITHHKTKSHLYIC